MNFDEQYKAAVSHSRDNFNKALGIDVKPSIGESDFMSELLDTYCVPEVDRCCHLARTPVQPWIMALPFIGWKCGPCMVNFSRGQSRSKSSFSIIEEFSCDRCRRYLPPGSLVPALLRQDIFTVICNICAKCAKAGEAQGGVSLDRS